MAKRPPSTPSTTHERQHRPTTSAPLVVPPGTLLIGTYEILEHLNTGGMGEVYRGVNIHNDEVVAIKIVLPALAHDEKILSLFQKESTVLRRIAHDAIVRYEVFTRDPALDRPCLIMEYAEGPSLSDRMEHGPLSLPEVMVLLTRLTAGLEVAHRGGVVHRDLSPDNVILCDNDVAQAKIIDFGIAKANTPGGRTLIGGQFAGKPGYVAPEQLGLYDGHVTGQADIYSLGLLAAAAALGHPLDMGDSPAAAVMARVKVPELDGIDPDLVPLLDWMLQPDPAARPGSMAEVSAWIAEHFSDLIAPEPPVTGSYSPQPMPPRSLAPGRSRPPSRGTAGPAPAPVKDRPSSRPPQSAAYQPTVLAERPPMPDGETTGGMPSDSATPTGPTPPQAATDDKQESAAPAARAATTPPSATSRNDGTPGSAAPLSDQEAPATSTSPPASDIMPVTASPVTPGPVSKPTTTVPPATAPVVTSPPASALSGSAPPEWTPPETVPPAEPHVTKPSAARIPDATALPDADGLAVPPSEETASAPAEPMAVPPFDVADREQSDRQKTLPPTGIVPPEVQAESAGSGPESASPFGPGPQSVPPTPPVRPASSGKSDGAGRPIVPIAAVLLLAAVGGGLWMSGIFGSDTEPRVAVVPPATTSPDPAPPPSPEPEPEPDPLPPDPQTMQAWLDSRIAEGPPEPCSWLPRGGSVSGLTGYAANLTALDALSADFENSFGQNLPVTVHPLSAAQCPAFDRLAALEQGRPPSGRMGFALPDQLERGTDAALEGQLAGQISGHLTVLVIDPAGRVQHITDLIAGGQFRLAGQRVAPPLDEVAQGAAAPVFTLLALDTTSPLPIMGELPSNAILPANNAEEFWRFLNRDLDALPEPPDFAYGIVIWSD